MLDVIRNASEYRHGECNIEEVGIYALSDYVLTVHLVKPANYLPKVLCHSAFSIVNRNPTVYSGPFYLNDMEPGYYSLKKNDYFSLWRSLFWMLALGFSRSATSSGTIAAETSI